jgi:hypothetical protein
MSVSCPSSARNDRNKEQFDEAGDVVNSSDDNFMQPSDKDAQGNVLTEEEQALIKMNDSKKTQHQRANRKMKIVPRRLNRTEEDSVNKNTNLTT